MLERYKEMKYVSPFVVFPISPYLRRRLDNTEEHRYVTNCWNCVHLSLLDNSYVRV
jgi:hypothetical protein